MLSFYDVEYTDPDGKPKKARTQAVNGLHTEALLREHLERHKQFGAGATITKITKLTDSAQQAEAAASRPELPHAVVKQIQAAENAGNVTLTPKPEAAPAEPLGPPDPRTGQLGPPRPEAEPQPAPEARQTAPAQA